MQEDDDDHLDREGEEVDLLQGLDLAVLDETAQLSHRHPFLTNRYLEIQHQKKNYGEKEIV